MKNVKPLKKILAGTSLLALMLFAILPAQASEEVNAKARAALPPFEEGWKRFVAAMERARDLRDTEGVTDEEVTKAFDEATQREKELNTLYADPIIQERTPEEEQAEAQAIHGMVDGLMNAIHTNTAQQMGVRVNPEAAEEITDAILRSATRKIEREKTS